VGIFSAQVYWPARTPFKKNVRWRHANTRSHLINARGGVGNGNRQAQRNDEPTSSRKKRPIFGPWASLFVGHSPLRGCSLLKVRTTGELPGLAGCLAHGPNLWPRHPRSFMRRLLMRHRKIRISAAPDFCWPVKIRVRATPSLQAPRIPPDLPASPFLQILALALAPSTRIERQSKSRSKIKSKIRQKRAAARLEYPPPPIFAGR
jgi:hypothetical protein